MTFTFKRPPQPPKTNYQVYQDRLGNYDFSTLEAAKQHIKDCVKYEFSIYVIEGEDDEATEEYKVDIDSIKFKKVTE